MRSSGKRSESAFWVGVLTMFGSQLAVKLLGLIYRLVITNIDGFGDMGNGYYSAGFQIYTLLLALSSVGIPSAISKLVAQAEAAGNHRRSEDVFQAAMALFFGVGLVCAAALYLGADWIVRYVIRMDGVQGTLRALSPAVLFVCLSSVLRGYYLGLGSARAAGSSQVVEQLLKSILTVAIVLALTGYSAQAMSAGANLATSIAAGGAAAYLALYHIRAKRKAGRPTAYRKLSKRSLFALSKTILRLSVPVSAASIIASVGSVIDTGTISRGIAAAFADGIPGQAGIPSAQELSQEAVRLMGVLSKGDSILNLPLALNTAFMTMLVPTVSGLLADRRNKAAVGKIEESLRMTVLLILPCAVGLIVLAEPIYLLLYPNAPQGWELLQISAVGMIFIALNQTVTGGLQGIGEVDAPAKALLCGVAVKAALNFLLIPIPAVNIHGAPIASAACYGTAFLFGFHRLKNTVRLSRSCSSYVLRTAFCAAVMGVGARLAYQVLDSLLRSNALALLATIAGSAVFYFALLLIFHRRFEVGKAKN